MQDDMKFLFDQLQAVIYSYAIKYCANNYVSFGKVKLQRDESWSRNRFLESKMQDIHGHVKEVNKLFIYSLSHYEFVVFINVLNVFIRYLIRGFCRSSRS